MTVKELIANLQECDQNARVFYSDYERGWLEVDGLYEQMALGNEQDIKRGDSMVNLV